MYYINSVVLNFKINVLEFRISSSIFEIQIIPLINSYKKINYIP